ncbi:Histidine kinase domain-containing protein [Candidatus Hydrogenisulfobacillus filiaventi]|uniref:histidine kinase n=1 Tax=Candidatus Hydrogenisulfobacillus filiaventi TaxID=2707344 RepID=A0A6F8ZJQ7_9FIRM|nr:Histidine kinase domain-containing protein [Candidatus Hydrogenisulfobacillus filiaventi]
MLQGMSLRHRLTIQAILAQLVLLAFIATITLGAVALHLFDSAKSEAGTVFRSLYPARPDTARQLLNAYTRHVDPHVWILHDGRVVATSANARHDPVRGGRYTHLRWAPQPVWRLVEHAGGKTYLIDWPLAPDLDLLRDLALVLSAVTAVSAVVAAFLARWATHRTLHPVSRMTRSVQAMLATNRFAPIPAPSPENDEFTQLAGILSRLITTLEQRWRQDRQVLAEAAHQLRTPLEVIRGNLELLNLCQPEEPAAPAQAGTTFAGRNLGEVCRESLGAIDRAAQDMTVLVTDLLTLERARLDSPPSLAALDLAPLVREVGEDAAALAPQLAVETVAPHPVWALGDALSTRRALWAVVENALRYTPSGGTVRLRAEAPDGQPRVVVEDTGPGIPSDELPHVFERFYRGSRARQTAGSGLGLPIARALMQTQGGRIELESRHPGGTRVTLHFVPRG